jgi:hypothetical protein
MEKLKGRIPGFFSFIGFGSNPAPSASEYQRASTCYIETKRQKRGELIFALSANGRRGEGHKLKDIKYLWTLEGTTDLTCFRKLKNSDP